MENNNKVSVENASVGTYIKLKTLERKIATQDNLESEINSYPSLVNYLRDNTDGSTWYGADVLVSGSHVFKAENPIEIISRLKNV